MRRKGGASASAATTALVAPNTEPPLTASGLVFQATEHTPFSGSVATFIDAEPGGAPGDYIAQINWGDGQSSSGSILADPAGGFVITGVHTYREPGTHPVIVTVSDRKGAADTAQSTAIVADAPLTALGQVLTATEHVAFTGVVASFIQRVGSERVWRRCSGAGSSHASSPSGQGSGARCSRTLPGRPCRATRSHRPFGRSAS